MAMDSVNDRQAVLSRVKQLTETISQLQTELAAIRSDCDHLPELAFNAQREVKYLCTTCGADLGYPDRPSLMKYLQQ